MDSPAAPVSLNISYADRRSVYQSESSSSFYNLGKNVGDDFKQGKVTLPILLAINHSNKEDKTELELKKIRMDLVLEKLEKMQKQR